MTESVQMTAAVASDTAPPSIASSVPVSAESSAAATVVTPFSPPTEASDPVASTGTNALKAPAVQCGVGVYLKLAQEGFVEVKATEPSCSADGLLFVGDIVTAVDGTTCVGLSVRDITRLIVGEEGSCVTISVMREFAVSLSSTKTLMREVPVLLTRRPLPQQRSSRAVKALSESSLQTPRGESQSQAVASRVDSQNFPVGSHQSSSLPALEDPNYLSAVHSSDAEAPMRQFFVSNVGSLPLKLAVFDCEDILRVSELVAPLSQYPLEHNTCVSPSHTHQPLPASHVAGTCHCRLVRVFASCFKAG
jgi:hypothetical protein